ncbi:MAG: hypothetical protein K0R78_824 [Pelosinus sp.]|nr:hypothetical protein [Pelosinus sp.]
MEEDRKSKAADCCCDLIFESMPGNRPSWIALASWLQATATGEICGRGNEGHIEVSAQGLVPLGVYTLFFVTDRGVWPAAPLGVVYTSDGFDPNRLIVNSDGILNYYVAPLDYNPLRGIPTPSGLAKITGVIISMHTNRLTNGISLGQPNVNVFTQLTAPMCSTRTE